MIRITQICVIWCIIKRISINSKEGICTVDKYKKLEKQPLRVVLAEFRFSQVLQISEYIPKLQDALRKTYPIPEMRKEQAVQVQLGGIHLQSIDRWAFVSANKKSAVDISQDRLVIYTSEYPRFNAFSGMCKQAIEALEEIVEPGLILRIGLRYCDMDLIEKEEKISDIVDSNFSFPASIDGLGAQQLARNEVSLGTDSGLLTIRTLYGIHNLVCMPDMQNLPITIENTDVASERIILDFDHIWDPKEESTKFETSKVLEELDRLHETSREAFWKITTDYARDEKWSQ